jgi:hypothetical protein
MPWQCDYCPFAFEKSFLEKGTVPDFRKCLPGARSPIRTVRGEAIIADMLTFP